jgi:hypothetical protein
VVRDRPTIAVFAVLFVMLGTAARPRAEEATQEERVTVRKTQERLHFELPPDWPIEKRGGVVAPIPIEEYLGQKFKAVDLRLQTFEQRLNGLDLRLRVLEEGVTSRAQRLKSSEGAASAGPEQP